MLTRPVLLIALLVAAAGLALYVRGLNAEFESGELLTTEAAISNDLAAQFLNLDDERLLERIRTLSFGQLQAMEKGDFRLMQTLVDRRRVKPALTLWSRFPQSYGDFSRLILPLNPKVADVEGVPLGESEISELFTNAVYWKNEELFLWAFQKLKIDENPNRLEPFLGHWTSNHGAKLEILKVLKGAQSKEAFCRFFKLEILSRRSDDAITRTYQDLLAEFSCSPSK